MLEVDWEQGTVLEDEVMLMLEEDSLLHAIGISHISFGF